MLKVKYIRTKNDEIIMFSEIMQHSEFEDYRPVSAGFVSFGLNNSGNPTVTCYGSSYSLNLKSKCEEDTNLAKLQFGFLDYD